MESILTNKKSMKDKSKAGKKMDNKKTEKIKEHHVISEVGVEVLIKI